MMGAWGRNVERLVLNCILNMAFRATTKYEIEPPPIVEKELFAASESRSFCQIKRFQGENTTLYSFT